MEYRCTLSLQSCTLLLIANGNCREDRGYMEIGRQLSSILLSGAEFSHISVRNPRPEMTQYFF
jgi:hypothetical protein